MEKAWKKSKFIQWLLSNPEVNGRTALKWTQNYSMELINVTDVTIQLRADVYMVMNPAFHQRQRIS